MFTPQQPAKRGTQGPTTPVMARLTRSEMDELNLIVARTGLSKSDIVRLALKHWSNTAKRYGYDLTPGGSR